MEGQLKGKKALITGGSRGIGKAIALAYAKEGADVAVTARDFEALRPIIEEIRTIGVRAEGYERDAGSIKGMDAFIAEVAEKLNGIDIVVNNAGVFMWQEFLKCTEENWDKTMDINLKGLFFTCQSTARYMIEKGIKGRIINICSDTAFRGAFNHYHISKWGVRGLTNGIAKQLLPHGILVNAIAPGHVATDMHHYRDAGFKMEIPTPFGRMAYPDEIADLAVYLASEAASRIAGEVILINGGY